MINKSKDIRTTLPGFLILGLILIMPSPSYAQCTSPASPAGNIDYFSGSEQVFKYCDGTSWIPWGDGGANEIWTKAGDSIYYDSGSAPRVGVGNTSPGYTLDVTGTGRFNDIVISGESGAAPLGTSLNDLDDVGVSSPSDGQILTYNNASSSWEASGAGGAGTPAGANTQIQFNSSGAFGADVDLTWDDSSNTMTVVNIDYSGYITDISDRRLKENITPLDDAMEGLLSLQGYSFTMKDDPDAAIEYGLMAQDVQSVFPELVKTHDDGILSLNYIGLIAPLVEANKTQQAIIDAQREQIDDLDARLKALEAVYGTGTKPEDIGEQ